MSNKKEPLLNKNSIELDILTKEGSFKKPVMKLNDLSVNNSFNTDISPNKDYYHDKKLILSQMFFLWVNKFLEVKILKEKLFY